MSKTEADQAGIDTAPPIYKEPWENKRTGQLELVPKGIDPGWDTNAGKTRLFDLSRDLPDCIPGKARNAAGGKGCISPVPGQDTWETLGLKSLTEMDESSHRKAPQKLKAADSLEDAHRIVDRIFRGDKPVGIVKTPVEDVIFTKNLIRHIVEKRQDARERFTHYIKAALERPHEVWATQYTDGIRNRYIAVFEGKDQLAVVVRVNKDGSVFWTAFSRDRLGRMNALRAGALIYTSKRERKKPE